MMVNYTFQPIKSWSCSVFPYNYFSHLLFPVMCVSDSSKSAQYRDHECLKGSWMMWSSIWTYTCILLWCFCGISAFFCGHTSWEPACSDGYSRVCTAVPGPQYFAELNYSQVRVVWHLTVARMPKITSMSTAVLAVSWLYCVIHFYMYLYSCFCHFK